MSRRKISRICAIFVNLSSQVVNCWLNWLVYGCLGVVCCLKFVVDVLLMIVSKLAFVYPFLTKA